MTSPLAGIDLDTVLASVLAEQAATVDAWLRDEPGSWGALAGQAVLAARRAAGRRLAEAERRIVWQALWDRLCERRAAACLERSEGSDERRMLGGE